jgi:hypothetical protein
MKDHTGNITYLLNLNIAKSSLQMSAVLEAADNPYHILFFQKPRAI